MICPLEVPVAESLIGVMTYSMIETGGGFGVFQGSMQTTSARLPGLDDAARGSVLEELCLLAYGKHNFSQEPSAGAQTAAVHCKGRRLRFRDYAASWSDQGIAGTA
jgi:hypothetical protein